MTKAQCKQKKQYNWRTRDINLKVGGCVMVFMTHETQGKQQKLALPYCGPYQVLELTLNIVTVRPVDQPDEQAIVVNQDQVTKCPPEFCMVPKKLHT